MRVKIIILLLLLVGESIGQTSIAPPIIRRLFSEKRGVIVKSYSSKNLAELKDLSDNFKFGGQEITKSRNGIFLNPLGTGRIYKLEKTLKDSLRWERIDSTIYTGYNFGSLFFNLDTSFYSFAGQGIFNHSGNLRTFNEATKEWDALNLSQSIMWVAKHGLFQSIDTANKILFIEAWPEHHDQSLKTRTIPHLQKSLWKLDIQTGEWTKIGYIKKGSMHIMAETPFGTMINFKQVVDIKKNKVYNLQQSTANKILLVFGTSSKPKELAYSYCIDSTLFFGGLDGFIDSVTLNRNDLIDISETFYTPIEEDFPIKEREVLIGLVVVLGITSLILFYKSSKKGGTQPPVFITGINQSADIKEEKNDKENQVVFRSGKLMDLLNEREKILLSFIYEHSLEERLTTIEEINKVIGAAQRNSEVQKRLRSDLIGTINDKLEIVSESKHNVIDKQRSEFDKRSFEYFIRPEHMQLVEKVLGKKAN
jgi:hypothetical protein